MYQRGNIWYADYYDAEGKRVRKSFPTKQLAIEAEAKAKRHSINSRLKNRKAARPLPNSCGPTSRAKTPPNAAAHSSQRGRSSQKRAESPQRNSASRTSRRRTSN
jgi:hypothetical protein